MPLVDAVIVRSGTKITRDVIEAGKGRLQVVGRAGVGVDNVDLKAATEFGCLVVNAPTANTVAAAEHGIALLCSLARMVPQVTPEAHTCPSQGPLHCTVAITLPRPATVQQRRSR